MTIVNALEEPNQFETNMQTNNIQTNQKHSRKHRVDDNQIRGTNRKHKRKHRVDDNEILGTNQKHTRKHRVDDTEIRGTNRKHTRKHRVDDNEILEERDGQQQSSNWNQKGTHGRGKTPLYQQSWIYLTVPRAHEWVEGLLLTEANANTPRYVVAFETDLASQGNGPNCLAVISNPIEAVPNHSHRETSDKDDVVVKAGDAVAVVCSSNERLSGFTIYTMQPNFDGQQSSVLDNAPDFLANDESKQLYEVGRLEQSFSGGAYTFRKKTGQRQEDHSVTLKATNSGIFGAVVLCGIPFFCAQWNLRFKNVPAQKEEGKEIPAFIRDQREASLAVAPGQDQLLAVCLTYAVDRLTNPCHSSECKAIANRTIVHVAASVVGAVVGVVVVNLLLSYT